MQKISGFSKAPRHSGKMGVHAYAEREGAATSQYFYRNKYNSKWWQLKDFRYLFLFAVRPKQQKTAKVVTFKKALKGTHLLHIFLELL